RVVVTRAREQASELKRLFEESGAQVVQFPTIEIVPPESWASLDRAVDEEWDWLIFTSTNGVSALFERLFARRKDVRSMASKDAAVGEATSASLRAHGIAPDVVPDKFLSSALIPLLPENPGRTAIVRAQEGRDELLDALRERGAEVHLAVAYRNVPVAHDAGE